MFNKVQSFDIIFADVAFKPSVRNSIHHRSFNSSYSSIAQPDLITGINYIALAPMAVALVKASDATVALYPNAVLFEPVVLD